MATIPATDDCTLRELTGDTAKAPNGEDALSFRDADRVPFDDTLSTANRDGCRRFGTVDRARREAGPST